MTTTLDPDYAKAVAIVKEAGIEPADPLLLPLADARKAQDRYFAFLAGTPPAVSDIQNYTLDGSAGSFGVRLYFPSTARPLPVVVFVRGGGWWAGSLDSHDRTMRLLANKSGLAVCGVDYHRAPDERFPTQLDELMTAIRWLRSARRSHGVERQHVVRTLKCTGGLRQRRADWNLVSEYLECGQPARAE